MNIYLKLPAVIIAFLPMGVLAQQQNKPDIFQKAGNVANRVSNTIAVFQPYLLKARQLFYDAKQLGADVKNASKASFGKNGTVQNTGVAGTGYGASNSSQNSYSNDNSGNSYQNNPSTNQQYGSNNGNSGYGSNAGSQVNSNSNGNGSNSYQNNNNGYDNNANPQNYLPNQSLPVNNPATVNNDATGNWGNQNNGLYGNCLDALTGTVMGMGDAAQSPASVDLMFFAPADGQNTYYLMTPGFARNNSSAAYMTEHVSEQVNQWNDVNETEVALTKMTVGQFNQVQNNGQIQSAVRNAQNYAGYYSSAGQKLDGQVFAIKAQMDNREVYALVAVVKQMGTSGNNGYLKIKIKAAGIDNGNGNGQVNVNAYIR